MDQINIDNSDSSGAMLLPAPAPLLPCIGSPEDLRKLDISELPALCGEIREYLVKNLSENPGHFGSSMGAVEIIVALHYAFNTPRDRIVFDVGHQAYAHKLLTGRLEAFKTQRTLGGISGFPTPLESEYDTFVCGHAGNSISAALGMAIADLNTPGEEDRKTIALIGDASISNGLAFEGLNNSSINPNNLLIILNDNDMSIDNNVGALHRYLSEITTSDGYNRWRYKVYNLFKRRGFVDDKRKGAVLRFSNALKSLISKQQNIFEGLNIRYFGPFDGNDVTKVVKVLREIKEMKGPRILHLHTVKGRGYKPAEENPGNWHAPGKFIPATGERIGSAGSGTPWQKIFGEALLELANKDERVIGITAAMPSGTSIDIMQHAMPNRVYDVGISEGHAVTFAGGLASAGKKPFVAIYSSFLQRGYDNVIHDVAIQGLPVTIAIDRAGVVGEDGVTHHGLFDMPMLRVIPGITIGVPSDATSLRDMMYTSLSYDGPFVIRYPRGKCKHDVESEFKKIEIGRGRKIHGNGSSDIAVLTIGPTADDALKAVESAGIEADVYDMLWLKPLDTDLIRDIASTHKAIITVEDGAIAGGFGTAVSEWLTDEKIEMPVTRLGVPDKWVTHGSTEQLKNICGYDAAGIARAIADAANAIKSRS